MIEKKRLQLIDFAQFSTPLTRLRAINVAVLSQVSNCYY